MQGLAAFLGEVPAMRCPRAAWGKPNQLSSLGGRYLGGSHQVLRGKAETHSGKLSMSTRVQGQAGCRGRLGFQHLGVLPLETRLRAEFHSTEALHLKARRSLRGVDGGVTQ